MESWTGLVLCQCTDLPVAKSFGSGPRRLTWSKLFAGVLKQSFHKTGCICLSYVCYYVETSKR